MKKDYYKSHIIQTRHSKHLMLSPDHLLTDPAHPVPGRLFVHYETVKITSITTQYKTTLKNIYKTIWILCVF